MIQNAMLLWNRLKSHTAAQPDKPALTCDDTTLTYSEFATRSEALAQSWLRQGAKPGDRIALHLRNGLDLARCYFACLASGCVAVPINSRLTPEEIAYVLDNSGATAYIAAPDLCISASLPSLSLETTSSHATTPLPNIDPDAVALLLYTSGTTARPKGVIHTQSTLAGNCRLMESWGITKDDHTLLFTSMVHVSGCIMLFLSPLWIGGTVTIVPAFDPAVVLDTWERSGATFFMTLPTLVRGLIAEQKANPRKITTGRLAIGGGDALPISLQETYATTFGHPMVEGFGMTEGLPTIANHPDHNRSGSMGRTVGDTEIRIVEGEMWLRGSAITPGYWGHEPLEDGWLKTGDLVEQDADGYIWFRGRKKEIIVRGGSNISPQEVEETLYRHPAIAEAGVIGEPDEHWGETVLAYVALRNGHDATCDEIRSFARQHLAEYKCPEQILILASLPKGPTGKVQRRALKELRTVTATA